MSAFSSTIETSSSCLSISAGAREAERHANDGGLLAVDVDGANGRSHAIVLRTQPHLEHVDRAIRKLEAERIADRVVVHGEALRGQRVRHVAHFIAVAQPHDVREVVLNDPEMVAVVVDIGGQQQRVASPTMRCLLRSGERQ
jgi:hypothetical protein